MSSVSLQRNSKLKISRKAIATFLFFVGLSIVYVIVNILTKGRFLSATNLETIIAHAVFPAILASGMIFVFSANIIDLSVGSKVIFTANVGAILAYNFNLGYVGLILGAIISWMLLQLLTSLIITDLKIPAWITGLGLAMVLEAVVAHYSSLRMQQNATSVINMTDELRVLGTMPTMLIIMLACSVLTYILFSKTKIGINIQAIGSNADVAQAMGVDRKKTIMIGAIVGAVFMGIAAVVQISYQSKLEAASGLGSLGLVFTALAVVLLARSINRILNTAVGIVVSAFVLMSVFNALTMLGVPSGTWQTVVLGVVLVVCGILSHIGYKGVVK